MAYDSKKLKKQALEAIDTLPKYKAFDGIIDIPKAQDIFYATFESEQAFIDKIISSVPTLIKSVYFDEPKQVEVEKWFKYRELGYFDFRADIYITGNKTDYLVEVKNPYHTLRESLTGITQLMMYDIVLSQTERDVQLIYVSSVIEPMVIDFIKKYDLDIEVFFMNGDQTAHWCNT